jgi:purine-binding chemotaxis protein CheW
MGIINVESRILALINIKKLFQLPDKGITNLNRVILLEHNGIEFGVLVDEVTGREQIDFAELRTGLPDIAGLDRKLICGVTPDRVIVINTQNLIADKKLYINEKV